MLGIVLAFVGAWMLTYTLVPWFSSKKSRIFEIIGIIFICISIVFIAVKSKLPYSLQEYTYGFPYETQEYEFSEEHGDDQTTIYFNKKGKNNKKTAISESDFEKEPVREGEPVITVSKKKYEWSKLKTFLFGGVPDDDGEIVDVRIIVPKNEE